MVPDPKNHTLYPCKEDHWVWMIDNLWETKDWKEKLDNASGSRSFASRTSMIGQPTITKLFEETHKRHRHGGVWINSKAMEHHATMTAKIIEQSQPGITNLLFEEEISVEVLGKRWGYLKGYGICKRKTSYSTQSKATDPEVIVL